MTRLISQPQTSHSPSHFEELCQVYAESFEQVANYLNACGQFAYELVTGLEKYLGCPDRRVQFLNAAGETSELNTALYSEGEFWCLDLDMTICREHAHRRRAVVYSGRYYPSQSVVIPVLFKQLAPEQFSAKLDGYQQTFTINLHQEQEFLAFYDYITAAIKTHYRNMVRHLMEDGETPLRLTGPAP